MRRLEGFEPDAFDARKSAPLREAICALRAQSYRAALLAGATRARALVATPCLTALVAIGAESTVPLLLEFAPSAESFDAIARFAGPRSIKPLAEFITRCARIEPKPAKALVRALDKILSRALNSASYEQLHAIATLPKGLSYQYQVTETHGGCWAGLKTTRQSTNSLDLTPLRGRAERALRNLDPPPFNQDDALIKGTLETLRQLIQRPSTSSSRVAAVRAAAKTRHPEAVTLFAQIFPKVDPTVQRAIIQGLVELGGPAARRVLLLLWIERSNAAAREALSAFGEEGILAGLVQLFQAAPTRTQLRILPAIANLESPLVVGALAALPTTKPQLKREIAALLARRDEPAALDALRELRDAADPETQSFALSAIPISTRADLDACLRALANSEPEIASGALALLREIEDEAASDALRGCLRHPHPPLRLQALEALAERGDPKVLAIILSYAKAPNPPMRHKALSMLAHYEDPRAHAQILAALDDPDPLPQARAIALLQDSAVEGATSKLLALLQARPSAEAKPIALALKAQGWVAKDKALSILYHRALGDYEILAKLGDASALEPLLGALARAPSYAKEGEVQKIVKLGIQGGLWSAQPASNEG